MMALFIPLLLAFTGAWGIYKQVDLFHALTTGAREGLKTAADILPSLVVLLTAVTMLRASGALEAMAGVCAPVFSLLGIPAETAPLVFLRPFTGSGALAVGSELMERFGPDSYPGRCAAVMLGSTETTFYVTTIYFSACGIKKSRYAIPAALCADLAGFAASALAVRLFFPVG